MRGFWRRRRWGYPIPRDDSFTIDSVAESLRLVMFEEGGKVYRDKIKEMKGMFCDEGRQDRHVENLLTFLQSNRSVKDDK